MDSDVTLRIFLQGFAISLRVHKMKTFNLLHSKQGCPVVGFHSIWFKRSSVCVCTGRSGLGMGKPEATKTRTPLV